MVQVRLVKAVRYPFDTTVVHRSGEVLDVEDKDVDRLREMGVLAEETETVPEEATSAPEEATAPEDEDVDVDVEDAGSPAPERAAGYPALPDATAPVAEWKEYARVNDIKLTGLTKRAEIIGFVTKATEKTE